VLVGPALERLKHPSIREVVTTDTIPVPAQKQLDGKIKVLSIASLLAQAILRVHLNRSVSQVFRDQHLDFAV
jgi:ribose-phosphate pyrophosphokinase